MAQYGLSLLLVLIAFSATSMSFPSGAPISACVSMMPGHVGISPQPNPAPYIIKTNSSSFQPGKAIQVQILGPSYRGILLETRTFAQTTLYGKWLQPPNNTKILACPGNTVGAVTHSNTNLKDQSTVYIWMPPESSSPGVFIFVATVAEAYDKYWLGIQSSVMYRGIRASSSANRFTWEAAVLTILFFQLAMFLLL